MVAGLNPSKSHHDHITTLTGGSAPLGDRVYSTESVRAAGELSAVLKRQIATDSSRSRVLTGEHPTGALHPGTTPEHQC